MTPMQRFLKVAASGGVLLILVTAMAIIWANSPLKVYSKSVWDFDFIVGLSPFELKKSLLHWINDGLMVIFFFVVGLEIKRELIAGKSSSFRQAAFPIVAGLGGYFLLKHTLPKADQMIVMK